MHGTICDNRMTDTQDVLTGLETLAGAERVLGEWAVRHHPIACPVHAMLVTLNRLDSVSAAFGDGAVDGGLVAVAERIARLADEEIDNGPWLAARLSGAEFLLVTAAPFTENRWSLLAEALADMIAQPIANPQGETNLRLWPRIALAVGQAEDRAAPLLDRLQATLAAMREGPVRRIAWVSGELHELPRGLSELDSDLMHAIDQGEIEIVFQPQYALSDNRVIGAEALARWHHPTLGQIGAIALFAIAERNDHTAQLSHHIAERALVLAREWPEYLRLSINITPQDLTAESFALEFAALARRTGFSLERVTLEITEQVLLADLDRVDAVLRQLKVFDVAIALDDFGAGFCNFRYLKALPIDLIKLDRSMVEDVTEDDRDLAIFRAIVAMAKALDIGVLVEGIETEDQRVLCAREGCRSFQGFLMSEPLSPPDFLALVARD